MHGGVQVLYEGVYERDQFVSVVEGQLYKV